VRLSIESDLQEALRALEGVADTAKRVRLFENFVADLQTRRSKRLTWCCQRVMRAWSVTNPTPGSGGDE
jgi:hypothetical protein